eukprot:CAMPEP_0170521000 /NCGR_PEP_ID=MMETSP0209-20121228/6339_1 /TAXON_ID=665100 ORGANISM="Litonotus pictus, Strain P1" /NCGR_SAMPLE_ID=MMETSP0209 /ASSEMBLY_ACC=CAM_ASM_000301 /LENGTH=382 /DNA_ID=CAMNT_0010807635 /DNA_START=30 /DNA_END=1175 /DNA_ORIENTATION=-
MKNYRYRSRSRSNDNKSNNRNNEDLNKANSHHESKYNHRSKNSDSPYEINTEKYSDFKIDSTTSQNIIIQDPKRVEDINLDTTSPSFATPVDSAHLVIKEEKDVIEHKVVEMGKELIEDIEFTLDDLNTNLSQIELLIEREKEEVNKTLEVQELQKMKEELKANLRYNKELLQYHQSLHSLNNTKLTYYDINKICSCFVKDEWCNAEILEIKKDLVTVKLLKNKKETLQLFFYLVKPNKEINLKEIRKEYTVDAISLKDGEWHESIILGIFKDNIEVKLLGCERVERARLDGIRITPAQRRENEKLKKVDEKPNKEISGNDFKNKDSSNNESQEFVIPNHLKLSSTDDEQQRLAKRKRVKALKHNFKQKNLEKDNKEKQESW